MNFGDGMSKIRFFSIVTLIELEISLKSAS